MESRVLLSAYTLNQIGYFGSNNTGARPQSTLVADSNGNVYGTASAGGAYSAGAVFEIPRGSTTITALASFNGANGSDPVAGLILDTSGNLYGTTQTGGTNNAGTIFEIASSTNTITVLASFSSANPHASGGVAVDPLGNLFGVSSSGGTSGYGTAFEIAKGSNTITTLASFTGANGNSPTGLTADAAGNLFGTTVAGGTNNDGTLFEIASGSNAITTLASFNGSNGQSPEAAPTLDASGNLYGTTKSGGANSAGTVFELASGATAITTIASFNGASGSAPIAAVALDGVGNIYGTTSAGGTYSAGTVFKIANGSTAATTLATFDSYASPAAGVTVTLDAAGNLFGTTLTGATYNEGSVFEVAHGSTGATTIASFDDINGTDPLAGLTLDASGNVYGTTQSGGPSSFGTVFEIARGSNAITTLASFLGANAASTGSEPQSALTLDSLGNLYGTTNQDGAGGAGTVFEIRKGTGTISSLASFDHTNGFGAKSAVTLDASGNIYGTTSLGGTNGDGIVYEIAKGSGTITTLTTFNSANGSQPSGLLLDAAGNLYGATFQGGARNGGTVFEIASGTNTITTLATFDGTNGANPNGLVWDASGNFYGTTWYGGAGGFGTVFELASRSSAVTTLATFNSNGSTGEHPETDLTLDAAGNLYGTTSAGGSGNGGTAFRLAKGSSTIKVIAFFNGTKGSRPYGVTLDAFGNLFGTTVSGGISGYGTVFELSANTAVTLAGTSASNPANANQALTFTATVSGSVRDGELVTLNDASNNNTSVASGTLASGSATLTVPAGMLSVGTHNLTAVYGGDANFAASESATYVQTVQAAPPSLVEAPVINGDNPNGLFTAPGQPNPGVQRSMVEDIVYTFNEPVTIPDANAAFTLVGAGPHAGVAPSTLLATAVPGSNGTQWAVSLTGKADGVLASIANGEYSITINPAYVFAAADGATAMTTGQTDTFFRLFGHINGDKVVNVADEFQFGKALNTYNPIFDVNGDGAVNLADEFQASKSFSSGGFLGDGFVTTI